VPGEQQPKTSPFRGQSAVRSGLVTSLSYVVLSVAGAVAGVYLAHKFGRNDETDGFMGAYGVYLVLVFGAQAFRMVVVPDLTRAAAERRLGGEFGGYAFAVLLVAVPTSVIVAAFPEFFGEVITGRLPHSSAVIAGDALVMLDPYTARKGPRLVARAATVDSERNLGSLDALRETGATTVLTGHGEPWREGIAAAVERARAVGPTG